jgi:lipopolysaccharide biosynthesis regulator YciM
MQELLLLLLPVAAASGWWAARRRAASDCDSVRRESDPIYFKGLNHLLNEEPDKAIDAFIQMLEVDSDTVETHLALGNLFRRRGEVERAIRIHQNLIARPALTSEQRGQSLLELGKDYMRAGLFDRAENLFRELKDAKLHVYSALQNLRQIYQQERDWQACLQVSEELRPFVDEPLNLERSHYFCELALEAIQRRAYDEARSLLNKAKGETRDCVRAAQLEGDVAAAQGDCRGAIRFYNHAVEIDSGHLPDLVPSLVGCYKKLGDLAGLKSYLSELLERHRSVTVELTLAELLQETEGDQAASSFLRERIERSPNLRTLLRLVEIDADEAPPDQARQTLLKLRQPLKRLLEERSPYQCNKCGFSAKSMHWQCPSCRSWSSIRRKPDIEHEQALPVRA